jgi:hypothetical protein
LENGLILFKLFFFLGKFRYFWASRDPKEGDIFIVLTDSELFFKSSVFDRDSEKQKQIVDDILYILLKKNVLK